MSEPVSSSPPEKEAKPGLSVEGSSKKLNEDSRTEAHAKDLEEVVTVGQGMGHQFEKKSFFQLTYCHHCADLLWGIKGQSFMCQVCNYITHERCVPFLKTPCRHILADSIQSPMAHRWTPIGHLKKKTHCNVCRKKISGECVLCEVCKYYSHKSCKDKAFNNCKACAIYSYGAPRSNSHHWIEGNLPSSARCQVCSKSCASSDCLTGFTCGWCGMEVHSGCLDTHQKTNPVCTFRDLWGLTLQPAAISHCNIIPLDEDAGTPESAAETPTSPTGAAEEDWTNGGKGKPVIVVDGNGERGFAKWSGNLHTICVSKTMTAQELLGLSLLKCGISDSADDYYLAEKTDPEGGQEREVEPSELPHNIQPKRQGILQLYIRHKVVHRSVSEQPEGRMYINSRQLPSTIAQVSILVSCSTPVSEIITNALIKFDLEEEEREDYCLVEVSQVVGVKERVLANADTPWTSFNELRKNSLTLSNRQRYYLRKHNKGVKTSICLWDVAKDVLKDKDLFIQYVNTLLSDVPAESAVAIEELEIGPAFPTLGSLIVTFPKSEQAGRLVFYMEQHPNKPKIALIPTIFPKVLAVAQEPVLVFVSGKSGIQGAQQLLSAFRCHLNPHQVWDLTQGGPMPGLWMFRHVKQFRILIGGGDGTFGWVLGALQEVKEYLTCPKPPSALLPLGTGNDLARALKWGEGYSGDVMQLLLSLEDANVTQLDRWSVCMKLAQPEVKSEPPTSDDPTTVIMSNYMGVGLDASISLDFHQARAKNPEKFNSRLYNMSYYMQVALQKMMNKDELQDLRRHVTLTVDGNHVELPDIAGLIVLNIQSWGAGANPWGSTSDPAYKPASYNDGLLEVVGVKGIMHMAQVQGSVRNAVRIAQGSEISMDLLSSAPVHVDGEPWTQPPSVITISKLSDAAIMLCGPNKSQSSQKSLVHTVSNSLAEALSSHGESPLAPDPNSIPDQ